MSETDKINEELRNYKLFKIQRINTKIQEFSELKQDLKTIRKREILNYLVAFLNVLAIGFFTYNCFKSYLDSYYLEINKSLIISNLILVLLLSLFLTYQFVMYNVKLKKHIRSSENAVRYFENESEKLKSIYENYVENYLENSKVKR